MLITIHTATPDLRDSSRYYESLGFEQLHDDPVIYTDGIALIEINPDRYARAGIRLYKNSWTPERELLSMLTPVVTCKEGYLARDPNGVSIYLTETQPGIDFSPKEKCFGVPGNFAGISLETTDLDRTSAIYEAIGFEKTGGSPESGYQMFSLNGFDLSIMRAGTCPHLFFNPSMTYFNGGNNPAVIERIRAAGIPITEEITAFNKNGIVDNVIIRDPGGYGFFIFND